MALQVGVALFGFCAGRRDDDRRDPADLQGASIAVAARPASGNTAGMLAAVEKI